MDWMDEMDWMDRRTEWTRWTKGQNGRDERHLHQKASADKFFAIFHGNGICIPFVSFVPSW